MSWFESIEQAFDIDITSIQDTISSQLQEASTFSEFLNLDALEQQQEQEEEEYEDDDDDFIGVKNHYNDDIENTNNIKNTSANNKDDNTIDNDSNITNTNTNDDPVWDWTPVKVNTNDNKDITNSAQSDRLSVVDLENSPMTINDHHHYKDTKISDDNKPKHDNTLKINKKNNTKTTSATTTSTAATTKPIEVSASEYMGKVKKPKSKYKTSKNLDFFGLSSSSSSTNTRYAYYYYYYYYYYY